MRIGKIKRILRYCIAAVWSVISLLGVPLTTAAQSEGQPSVILEIAMLMNSPNDVLLFTLTNNSEQEFTTTPIMTNYNKVVIVSPNGESFERASNKDGIAPVVVKPGESNSWEINMNLIFKAEEMIEKGTYHISWKVGNLVSPEIVLELQTVNEDKK